jgi:hypothetical protein
MSRTRIEVRAHDVHLVDVDHAGDMIVVGLTPDGLGLGLHAALGAQNGHRAVQHAQRALTSTVKSTWPGVSMMLMLAIPSRSRWWRRT